MDFFENKTMLTVSYSSGHTQFINLNVILLATLILILKSNMPSEMNCLVFLSSQCRAHTVN